MNQSRAVTCLWDPKTVQQTPVKRFLFGDIEAQFLQKSGGTYA